MVDTVSIPGHQRQSSQLKPLHEHEVTSPSPPPRCPRLSYGLVWLQVDEVRRLAQEWTQFFREQAQDGDRDAFIADRVRDDSSLGRFVSFFFC